MSHKEVTKHIVSEITSNQKRIDTKVKDVAKQMLKASKKVHAYQQKIGSNTLLTVYIYGIDKKGIDYAVGCWYHSSDGYVWVTKGAIGVNFFTAHFFHRYAQRCLKKELTVLETAFEFYKDFRISATQLTRDLGNGILKAQLPLHGGLALGECDKVNQYVLYRTFVSKDDLFQDQVEDIDADSDLNKAIQSLDSIHYKLIIETLRLNS
ncbi:hypothetical protein [Chryseolinea lacunae]|uniref:Uncharacterized protein n=1 Tax=Chryseolinea lacunae TaxID=2801331 RepID=A0ABS1KZQ8_9BACT|nr:hypothetical protein [Chryseolinea lacunae]MBL0744830.1 hypothetical protein [Chryseolinea lacunae]